MDQDQPQQVEQQVDAETGSRQQSADDYLRSIMSGEPATQDAQEQKTEDTKPDEDSEQEQEEKPEEKPEERKLSDQHRALTRRQRRIEAREREADAKLREYEGLHSQAKEQLERMSAIHRHITEGDAVDVVRGIAEARGMALPDFIRQLVGGGATEDTRGSREVRELRRELHELRQEREQSAVQRREQEERAAVDSWKRSIARMATPDVYPFLEGIDVAREAHAIVDELARHPDVVAGRADLPSDSEVLQYLNTRERERYERIRQRAEPAPAQGARAGGHRPAPLSNATAAAHSRVDANPSESVEARRREADRWLAKHLGVDS